MDRFLLIVALLLASTAVSSQVEDGTSLALAFQREVDRRLDVPQPDQTLYAQLIEAALASAATPLATSQYLLAADRNPYVQAAFVYWLDTQAAAERLHFIGASPASTGNLLRLRESVRQVPSRMMAVEGAQLSLIGIL